MALLSKVKVAEFLASRPSEELRRFIRALLLVAVHNARANDERRDEGAPADLEASEGDFTDVLEWLSCLACGGDPSNKMRRSGCAGVCGAVWSRNEIAYRCRTCEYDSTCAICVACFQAGNHEGHDYFLIRTNGGCCDCGDPDAWKPSGFCGLHGCSSGTGDGLSPELRGAASITFGEIALWLVHLMSGTLPPWDNPDQATVSNSPDMDVQMPDTTAIVNSGAAEWTESTINVLRDKGVDEAVMLYLSDRPRHGFGSAGMLTLSFMNSQLQALVLALSKWLRSLCEYGSGIQALLASTLCHTPGFLDCVVSASALKCPEPSRQALTMLVYKLFGDTEFKRAFAVAFIRHYPDHIHSLEARARSPEQEAAAGSLIDMYSVQVFTVPSLTPVLVEEEGLLEMLLTVADEALRHLPAEFDKFPYARVIEDLRYTLSHKKASRIAVMRTDLRDRLIDLLCQVQGHNPQRRIRTRHVEYTSDAWVGGYAMEAHVASLCPLLVEGAVGEDWTAQMVPKGLLLLSGGTLDALQEWLVADANVLLDRILEQIHISNGPGQPAPVSDRRTGTAGEYCSVPVGEVSKASLNRSIVCGEACTPMLVFLRLASLVKAKVQEAIMRAVDKFDKETFGESTSKAPSHSVAPAVLLRQAYSLLSLSDREGLESAGTTSAESAPVYSDSMSLLAEFYNVLKFDVGLFPVSFHLPLHRQLAHTIHWCVGNLKGESQSHSLEDLGLTQSWALQVSEHPLRLQVLCFQVSAGMWRRNGYPVAAMRDLYYNVTWCQDGLELDLFLLQCCFALLSPENVLDTVIARFGVGDVLQGTNGRAYSLGDEYVPRMINGLLTFLLNIAAERSCACTDTGMLLKQELIRRLAVGDATHSELMKTLPSRLLDKDSQTHPVLQEVAEFKHPAGLSQGQYSLRKESWKYLDLHQSRWLQRDLQRAEERYLEACGHAAVVQRFPSWQGVPELLARLAKVFISNPLRHILAKVLSLRLQGSPLVDDECCFKALHLLALGVRMCLDPSLLSQNDFAREAAEYVQGLGSGPQSIVVLLEGLRLANATSDVGKCCEEIQAEFSRSHGSLSVAVRASKTTFEDGAEKEKEKEERRRAAGKARQAAILQQMRESQARFADTLEDIDMENACDEPASGRSQVEDFARQCQPCALCRVEDSTDSMCLVGYAHSCRVHVLSERCPPAWHSGTGVAEPLSAHRPPQPSIEQSSMAVQYSIEDLLELDEVWQFKDTDLLGKSGAWMVREERANYSEVENDNRRRGGSLVVEGMMAEPGCAPSQDSAVANAPRSSQQDMTAILSHMREAIETHLDTEAYGAGEAARLARLADAAFLLYQAPIGLMGEPNDDQDVISRAKLHDLDLASCRFASCGHHVHTKCLLNYFRTVQPRGGLALDTENGEYSCPLCRSLCNCAVPSGLAAPSWKPVGGPLSSSVASHEKAVSEAADWIWGGLSQLEALEKEHRVPDVVQTSSILALVASLARACIPLPRLSHARIMRELLRTQSWGLPELAWVWEALAGGIVSQEISQRSGKKLTDKAMRPLAVLGRLLSSRWESSMSGTLRNVRREEYLEALTRWKRPCTSERKCLLARDPFAFLCSALAGIEMSRSAFQHLSTMAYLITVVQITLGGEGDAYTYVQREGTGWSPPKWLKRGAEFAPICALMFRIRTVLAHLTCDLEPRPGVDGQLQEECDQLVNLIGALPADPGSPQAPDGAWRALLRDLAAVHPQRTASTQGGHDEIVVGLLRRVLPFARRCALLRYSLFGEDAEGLRNDWSMSTNPSWHDEAEDAKQLVSSMSWPTPASIFSASPDSPTLMIALLWTMQLIASNFFVQEPMAEESDNGQLSLIRERGPLHLTPASCLVKPGTASPLRLIQLPQRYEDLLTSFASSKCERCGTAPLNPALCLFCGRFVCAGATCCGNQEIAECSLHCLACSLGLGAYLILKDTRVLLLRGEKRCVWGSLYLDAYGEEDPSLRRGRPLTLSLERLILLTNAIASQEVDYSAHVAGRIVLDGYHW
mmetsp:Transcript_3143/g.11325  ORF Transcript_3143/g.11325 Transcript_3143/m.11325 type:complete len:2016 (+) Transcript_3143:228-6275(+)